MAALRLLVFIEASLVLWFTTVVWLRYYRRYRNAVVRGLGGRRKHVPGRRDARKSDTDWIGLLPKHVWLVSTFTILATVQAVAVSASRIGKALVWYGTPLSLVEMTLLLGGLFAISAYENRVSGRK